VEGQPEKSELYILWEKVMNFWILLSYLDIKIRVSVSSDFRAINVEKFITM